MRYFSNAALKSMAVLCRFLSLLFGNAGLLAVLALIISPIGPHLLLSQSGPAFKGYGGNCTYFGSRGTVHIYRGHCAVLRIIDNRKG